MPQWKYGPPGPGYVVGRGGQQGGDDEETRRRLQQAMFLDAISRAYQEPANQPSNNPLVEMLVQADTGRRGQAAELAGRMLGEKERFRNALDEQAMRFEHERAMEEDKAQREAPLVGAQISSAEAAGEASRAEGRLSRAQRKKLIGRPEAPVETMSPEEQRVAEFKRALLGDEARKAQAEGKPIPARVYEAAGLSPAPEEPNPFGDAAARIGTITSVATTRGTGSITGKPGPNSAYDQVAKEEGGLNAARDQAIRDLLKQGKKPAEIGWIARQSWEAQGGTAKAGHKYGENWRKRAEELLALGPSQTEGGGR